MKAAYLTAIRELEIRDVPEPRLQEPDDVLLQVETVGVCGSDIHYYRTGRIGDQVVEFPFVLGHELSGRVVDVGPDAGRVKVGQRVAVDPLAPCGACDQCLSGRMHTCRNQKFLGCPGQAAGCLCEYIVMPASSCFPVGENVSATQTALIEPLAIGVYAQQLGGSTDGKTIVILGSGPIGLCVLLACRAAGDCKVYATDLIDERLVVARKLGANWTGKPTDLDVVAEIAAAEPLGVDLAFECAGEQETLDQGVELLAPGGKFMMVGIPETDRVSFSPARMRRKELTLQNVRRQNECEQLAVDMVSDGRITVDSLATHDFSLHQTKEALDLVDAYGDGVVKAMIHVARS